MIRATDEARAWLKKAHPEIKCWRCARCGTIGENECFCLSTEDPTAHMRMPYSVATTCGDCFTWELKAAVVEAMDRLNYMGVDSLPPMIRDVYRILEAAVYAERRIKWLTKGGAK